MFKTNNTSIDYKQLNDAIEKVMEKTSINAHNNKDTRFTAPNCHALNIESIPLLFSVHELLNYDQDAFIDACYQYILRRQADPVGLEQRRKQLDSGMSKLDIILRLIHSREAFNKGVRVNGFYKAWLKEKYFTLPYARKFYPFVHKGYLIAKKASQQTFIKNIVLWGQSFLLLGKNANYVNFLTEQQQIMQQQMNTQEKFQSHIRSLEEQHAIKNQLLKKQLASNLQQLRALERKIQQATSLNSSPTLEPAETLVSVNSDKFEQFYLDFEDSFRGEPQAIYHRLEIYLPIIQTLMENEKNASEQALILDIGCGRGEWLKLLQENHYACCGIDMNPIMVESCLSQGLKVTKAEALAYLKSLADESLLLISGFHIIEHISFDHLIEIFDECLRVLRPQGLMLFETPNSENILVGTQNFYMDPSHQNPLPYALIEFLAHHRGFSQVEIMKLHPYPDEFQIKKEPLTQCAQQINRYFYGAQDYAVLGYK